MPLPRLLDRAINEVAARIAPTRWKHFNELRYWRRTQAAAGTLTNAHYVHAYTEHFGIAPEDYRGKVLVDIGCGPRGSLEWASMAARRIGVDPLADEYRKLGASAHAMEYIAANAEAIPLPDGVADYVFSFNSLDHVDDVDRTIAQIKRLVKPGGRFLLLVEINHPPTACEPHEMKVAPLIAAFAPEFDCMRHAVFAQTHPGVYDALRDPRPLPADTTEQAFLSAMFVRV